MPFDVVWEKNGVHVKFSGKFDFEINSIVAGIIFKDPRSQDLKYVIWDTSGVSEVHMPLDESRILSMQDQIASYHLPKIKLAMLVVDEKTRQSCEQYMAHYQTKQTGWSIMISDSMETLRGWITT